MTQRPNLRGDFRERRPYRTWSHRRIRCDGGGARRCSDPSHRRHGDRQQDLPAAEAGQADQLALQPRLLLGRPEGDGLPEPPQCPADPEAESVSRCRVDLLRRAVPAADRREPHVPWQLPPRALLLVDDLQVTDRRADRPRVPSARCPDRSRPWLGQPLPAAQPPRCAPPGLHDARRRRPDPPGPSTKTRSTPARPIRALASA